MQPKSKTCLFKGLNSQTNLDEKFLNLYYSIQNNILDEIIVYIEQRLKMMGKFRFVE